MKVWSKTLCKWVPWLGTRAAWLALPAASAVAISLCVKPAVFRLGPAKGAQSVPISHPIAGRRAVARPGLISAPMGTPYSYAPLPAVSPVPAFNQFLTGPLPPSAPTTLPPQTPPTNVPEPSSLLLLVLPLLILLRITLAK